MGRVRRQGRQRDLGDVKSTRRQSARQEVRAVEVGGTHRQAADNAESEQAEREFERLEREPDHERDDLSRTPQPVSSAVK